jgi:hypothetical protein
VCTIAVEQTARLLDDPFEELVGVGERRDACGDVTERALGLGAPGECPLGPLQLVDEPRVRDRDRGLLGESAQDRDVDRVERLWLMTSMAPSGPASPMIGAAMRPRTFASSASESVSTSWSNSAV